MDLDMFTAQLDAAYQRVAELHDQTTCVPVHRVALKVALAELDTSLEELRAAEEELHAQNQELLATRAALEAEHRRYHSLFEGAPDGYLVTTLDGTIQTANRAAGMLLNLSLQFLVGLPLPLFVPDDERRRFRDELSQLRQRGWRADWDVRLQPHQGTLVDVALAVTVERDHKGQPTALRWLLRDITARKQAEAQLAALNRELEHRVHERTEQLAAANQALAVANAEKDALLTREQQARADAEAALHLRDEFLAIAAHELKTPLTALLGYTHILQHAIADRAEQPAAQEQQALAGLRRQTMRLNTLIDSLLDLGQLQGGQFCLQCQRLDLVRLVQDLVANLRPLLHEHTIELRATSEPVIVEGDRVRLEQVLQNLLENAIKYSPEGGPITVLVEQQDDQAVLTVTDRGIGIPEAAQAHLFQKFYRADNGQTLYSNGFGIGLYLVHEIVTQHGGTVQVTSREGCGSTFTICLPCKCNGALIERMVGASSS